VDYRQSYHGFKQIIDYYGSRGLSIYLIIGSDGLSTILLWVQEDYQQLKADSCA
jgi:hypothetical protein